MPCLLCLMVGDALLPSLQATERAQSWKPETLPGASQLKLCAVEWIVLPPEASDELQVAAQDLVGLWPEVRCGTQLRYLNDGSLPKHSLVLERTDTDWLVERYGSFSIHRERTRIIVRAASDDGLANGVNALCRDVLGARWYWAMDLGFEQVGRIPDKFPERRWREAPDFVQRRLHPADADFGRRNRLNSVYSFNHALAKVFTAELYEQNPELFALVKGRRSRPKGRGATDPQPDFTNPRVVEVAAQAALAHFEEHPESRSFSLSINDNVLFDTSEWTELAVEPVRYFRERPNYTDLVFGFMNQVAEAMERAEGGNLTPEIDARIRRSDARVGSLQVSGLKSQPSDIWTTPSGEPRYLTALAYFWTEPSPSIDIHPRVMPVLTSDRAQWHDPKYREEDKALAERWMDSGVERMATWDYYFGAPYPYPRQFTQSIDESLKHLNEVGVDVFFSQLPSAWGMDGPKAWLAAELLWDAQQDAAVLLDEFYTNFFGAAAEPMRAFYELAETHRNEHEGEAEWIKLYKDEAGIELFTPEVIEAMRGQLQVAAELVADDPRPAARVQVASDAFRFTELYAKMHRARVELVETVLGQGVASNAPTLEGAPRDAAALPELIEGFVVARAEYQDYAKSLIKDPMHSRLSLFTRMLQSDPVPLALNLADGVSVKGYEHVRAAVDGWDRDQAISLLPNVALNHDGFTRFSFLGPYVPLIDAWKFDFRPSQHFKLLEVDPGRGIRIEGADMCSMFTDVAVEAGTAYFLELDCAYSISPDNRTQVQLSWKDDAGKLLKVQLPLRFPNGQSQGVTSVTIPMVAPEGATELRVHFTQSRQYRGDFFELYSVDLKR